MNSKSGIIPSLELSTIFSMQEPSSHDGFQYGRIGNPTRQHLENKLAELHNSTYAVVFSSGSAAIHNILILLKQGDEIICHQQMYEGTVRLLQKVFNNFGINTRFINLKNVQNLKKNISEKTKLLIIESPTNPLLEELDVETLCAIAKKHNILTVVDNTIASALTQKPLKLGADMVVESLTKITNGHSDAMGGAVFSNDKKISDKLKFFQHTIGAILSPFDSWLILRGLKTLEIRHKLIMENKVVIEKFLKNNKSLEKVFSSSLGPLISFRVNNKISPHLFITSLKKIIIGHSFGGTETIIQQPSIMMDLSSNSDPRINEKLFRLSVGLEQASDLILDLKQALKKSSRLKLTNDLDFEENQT